MIGLAWQVLWIYMFLEQSVSELCLTVDSQGWILFTIQCLVWIEKEANLLGGAGIYRGLPE